MGVPAPGGVVRGARPRRGQGDRARERARPSTTCSSRRSRQPARLPAPAGEPRGPGARVRAVQPAAARPAAALHARQRLRARLPHAAGGDREHARAAARGEGGDGRDQATPPRAPGVRDPRRDGADAAGGREDRDRRVRRQGEHGGDQRARPAAAALRRRDAPARRARVGADVGQRRDEREHPELRRPRDRRADVGRGPRAGSGADRARLRARAAQAAPALPPAGEAVAA